MCVRERGGGRERKSFLDAVVRVCGVRAVECSGLSVCAFLCRSSCVWGVGPGMGGARFCVGYRVLVWVVRVFVQVIVWGVGPGMGGVDTRTVTCLMLVGVSVLFWFLLLLFVVVVVWLCLLLTELCPEL